MPNKNYLVSAIVSVYNCERFIEGCLEDLERQTIADKLEIVVVNSGSQQNEEAIIKKFQEKYDNIAYIKTENRETIYQAWNRGIKAASGKYITNANSDDRHKKDALETLVNELENNKDTDLVYYDFIVTDTENEIFDNCTPVAYQNFPEFDEFRFIRGPSYGHQPMWRKIIHDKIIYFDESFEVAGDYEFWIRLSLSEKCKFKHIKEYLGLYFKNPNSLERRNAHIVTSEILRAVDKHILNASYDKTLFKKIKNRQSERTCALGYMYLKRKQPLLALKTFLRSFLYNWLNLEGYKGIFICFLPPDKVEVLIKTKKNLKNIIKNRFRIKCKAGL